MITNLVTKGQCKEYRRRNTGEEESITLSTIGHFGSSGYFLPPPQEAPRKMWYCLKEEIHNKLHFLIENR